MTNDAWPRNPVIRRNRLRRHCCENHNVLLGSVLFVWLTFAAVTRLPERSPPREFRVRYLRDRGCLGDRSTVPRNRILVMTDQSLVPRVCLMASLHHRNVHRFSRVQPLSEPWHTQYLRRNRYHLYISYRPHIHNYRHTWGLCAF